MRIHTYMHTYIHTYTKSSQNSNNKQHHDLWVKWKWIPRKRYIPTHTYTHTYCIHTHICTYMHTYIHTQRVAKTAMTYNIMIRGYGRKGYLEDAMNELSAMESSGFEPTQVNTCTFVMQHKTEFEAAQVNTRKFVTRYKKGFEPTQVNICTCVI